jgi:hypothetical protein
MKHFKHFGVHGGMHALTFLIVLAAIVWIVMLLWNALLPVIFGLSVINYWQAAGLIILSRLLLGGFGKLGRGNCRGGHGFHGRHHLKREELVDMHDKVKGMSHQERREFIRQRLSDAENEEK